MSSPPQNFMQETGVRAPVLWALIALAYLFEVGAIAVLINTDGGMKTFATVAALAMPPLMMVVVFAIRVINEELFYFSVDATGKAARVAVQDAKKNDGGDQ